MNMGASPTRSEWTIKADYKNVLVVNCRWGDQRLIFIDFPGFRATEIKEWMNKSHARGLGSKHWSNLCVPPLFNCWHTLVRSTISARVHTAISSKHSLHLSFFIVFQQVQCLISIRWCFWDAKRDVCSGGDAAFNCLIHCKFWIH